MRNSGVESGLTFPRRRVSISGRFTSARPAFVQGRRLAAYAVCDDEPEFARDGAEIALRTEIGTWRLALPKGRPSATVIRGAARIRQGRLCQLITGYEGVEEMSRRAGVVIPRKLPASLAALFPERHPFILRTNRF